MAREQDCCCQCFRLIAVRKDGKIGLHKVKVVHCQGSGKEPFVEGWQPFDTELLDEVERCAIITVQIVHYYEGDKRKSKQDDIAGIKELVKEAINPFVFPLEDEDISVTHTDYEGISIADAIKEFGGHMANPLDTLDRLIKELDD